jgi:hypothetical protein
MLHMRMMKPRQTDFGHGVAKQWVTYELPVAGWPKIQYFLLLHIFQLIRSMLFDGKTGPAYTP